MESDTLYEKDFYGWIYHHIDLLRQGKLAEIDTELLIEELEGMAKRDRRELISRLMILIAHLLKWQFQPEQRSGSWRGSIREQRIQIAQQLLESPSLKSHLVESIAKAYPDALELASSETGLAFSVFPTICPYQVTQLLDKEFYPDNRG